MTRTSLFRGLALAALLAASGGRASGQGPQVLFAVDEQGGGFLNAGAGLVPMPGVLLPDPGPGGRAMALTYDLRQPPGLVAGDLIVLEPGSVAHITDVIRFNPAGTAPGYPGSLVYYSERTPESHTTASIGLPADYYANYTLIRGPENKYFTYTPTANQPGFIPGFAASYLFVGGGRVVPEPGSLGLMGLGGACVAALMARRRARRQGR